MKFNIHAGHNPAGKVACGAVSILNESAENRIVKNEVVRLLGLLGHTVYDCTVDNGKSQADVLTRIVEKCNAHDVDLDVSIHLNSGRNDLNGDKSTGGVECFIYDSKSKAAEKNAKEICASVAKSLHLNNRGVKVNSKFYYLAKTKAQAIIVECCFVDDKDDAERWDAIVCAKAIVMALVGKLPEDKYVQINTEAEKTGADSAGGNSEAIYRVQVGAYRNLEYARNLQRSLAEKGIASFVIRG